MPPNVQTLIELQSGWRHILLTHARHPNMNSEMQAKKPRNKQTSERTSGWRCPITKHTLQILLLGSNHMQSPKNHQKKCWIRTKGRPGVLRTAPNSQQTKDYFLGQSTGYRWLENETNQKNRFQLECSSFSGFSYHTVFCRKNSNIWKQFKN